jgi:hypothetical protein
MIYSYQLFLVTTYRQGTDERANRALDFLQQSFRCCGSNGRGSFHNYVPLTCNMYNIGCLTITMDFLNSCMDALSSVLLTFSLIQLVIVLFFYAYLCIYQHEHRKHAQSLTSNHLSTHHRSSSFDASSTESLPKMVRPISFENDEHDDNEQQCHTSTNDEYFSTTIVSPTVLIDPLDLYALNSTRKLSSITERTETDESESDGSHLKLYAHKRNRLVNKKSSSPSLVNNRQQIIVNNNDYQHDSGS